MMLRECGIMILLYIYAVSCTDDSTSSHKIVTDAENSSSDSTKQKNSAEVAQKQRIESKAQSLRRLAAAAASRLQAENVRERRGISKGVDCSEGSGYDEEMAERRVQMDGQEFVLASNDLAAIEQRVGDSMSVMVEQDDSIEYVLGTATQQMML